MGRCLRFLTRRTVRIRIRLIILIFKNRLATTIVAKRPVSKIHNYVFYLGDKNVCQTKIVCRDGSRQRELQKRTDHVEGR